MEEKQMFNALTVYRERARYLRRLEQFDKSIAAYEEAYKAAPDGADVRLLTGLSLVCGDAMLPQQAYASAEAAIKLAPHNMGAFNMQARAMYTMTDFERSLVINHRGMRLRKQPPYFREGINQGLETLQDCIGENSSRVMLDFLPLIKQLEKKRADDYKLNETVHVSRIPKPEAKKKMSQIEARQQKTLARVMAMKYLGPMASDKFFLQSLMDDKRIFSANAADSGKLKSIIQEALNSLCQRQEMLRSQRPYYTIKLAENSASSYQTKFMEAMLVKEQQTGARTSERLLRAMEKSLKAQKVKDVITQAERMQLFLDTKTIRTLPDKDIYTDRLYRIVGEAYLSQHRLSYTLSEGSNRRRIGFLMGLPIGRPRSFDSVIAHYPFKFVDIKEVTKRVMETLEICENATMKCWLQYELARLLCKQKNYALAKFYAKRCQRDAQEIGNVTWWLNGCFVLMSGDMQQANANEVRIAVDEAYEWTKRIPDAERVCSFLSKCAQMAAETVGADERKAIKHRERQVLGVLLPEQKPEAEVLFKRMWTVPGGRRFSVLPGIARPAAEPVRRRRLQRGLTVVPGHPRPMPAPPRSRTLGLQLFDV